MDDEEAVLSSECKVLMGVGINNLQTCQDPREVIPLLEQREAEAILLDIAMPHITGDVLLAEIHERFPQIPVIIITASDDIESAVRCMKAGAFDYMVKAVEPNRLVSGVQRAIELRVISRQYASLRKGMMADGIQNADAFKSIITQNQRMTSIFVFIESIAPTAETVLIRGETGTGKELIAEAIHAVSNRKGPLVKVNTAGLDEAMFADTLFGHAKGAFTGAEEQRKGLVQQAEGGTLLLDEIGDLSPACQIKILRLVEAHEFFALGSDLVRTTDARFVLATNRNLEESVSAGQFRKDLYFRLQTHEIRIPPLRERREDLPLLLDHFQELACQNLSKDRLAVPPELLTLLETYDFPGNVRELRSMVFNAVSRQREKMLSLNPFREAMGHVGAKALPPASADSLNFPDKLPTIKEVTAQLIDEALQRARGNQAIAAGLLGISPQALSKRLSRKEKDRSSN